MCLGENRSSLYVWWMKESSLCDQWLSKDWSNSKNIWPSIIFIELLLFTAWKNKLINWYVWEYSFILNVKDIDIIFISVLFNNNFCKRLKWASVLPESWSKEVFLFLTKFWLALPIVAWGLVLVKLSVRSYNNNILNCSYINYNCKCFVVIHCR